MLYSQLIRIYIFYLLIIMNKKSKIEKIFRTSTVFDIIPPKRWWEENNADENDIENDAQSDSSNNDQSSEIDLSNNKNIKKFTTLEHCGVVFPQAYIPHGIHIKYKGNPIKLNVYSEELASFWAQILDNDLSMKEIPRANFFKAFKQSLKDEIFKDSTLEDFDFSPIYEYILANRLKNKNKSKEEKGIEKQKKQEQNEYYGLALVDGFPEKVSNYIVEPPGIYRGRGDHPGCGRIKPRILPEDVTINVGYDNPVPICNLPGHCWKEVINNENCTWLSMYKEEKNTKYLFLSGNSQFKGKSDLKKYEKAKKLKSLIGMIREDYNKNMNSNSIEKKQLGVATYLIDILALRVGNEKGSDEADTVGCCSLRVEHIKLNGVNESNPNDVTFDFLGKDSIQYLKTVELDSLVVCCMREFIKGKKGSDDLFELINAGKLNDYLKSLYKNLSAKVFRTYNASHTLQKELDKYEEVVNNRNTLKIAQEEKIEFYNNANRQVAILCNHQKAVGKNFESATLVLNQQLKENLEYLEEIREHLESFKSKGKSKKKVVSSSKNNEEEEEDDGKSKRVKRIFPDSIEKTRKVVEKLEEKITKLEKTINNREDNKQIALNTSKLNYMDPRITVSWCKKYEVPIEKVFPKSVLDKFPWAMYTNPDYKF